MATHSSVLVWRIPWTEEPGGLQSMSSQRFGHNWVNNNFTFLNFKPHDRKFTIYHFLNSTSKGKKKPNDFLTSVYADTGNLRHHKNLLEYSWPLKNMGLNFKGLLKCGFFSMVKTTIQSILADFEHTQLQTWRNPGHEEPTVNYTCVFNCESSCP